MNRTNKDEIVMAFAKDFDFLERMTSNVTITLNDVEGILVNNSKYARTDCIDYVTKLKLQCDKIINRVNEYKK